MEIHEQPQGAVVVLKPIGALTEADADAFRAKALDTATKHLGRVVIDVSAVPCVDSRGIEAMVDVTEQLSDGGRALKLCGSNATVKQVLALTGWDTAFEFYDDPNTAVRSFL